MKLNLVIENKYNEKNDTPRRKPSLHTNRKHPNPIFIVYATVNGCQKQHSQATSLGSNCTQKFLYKIIPSQLKYDNDRDKMYPTALRTMAAGWQLLHC